MMRPPTPEEIAAAREAAGLSKTEAAAMLHVGYRTWQKWESGERQMSPDTWELFLRKTGQEDRWIDLSDIPEVTAEQFASAKLRWGVGRPPMSEIPADAQISLRLPAALKQALSQAARHRGMSTNRLAIEALENYLRSQGSGLP